MKTEIINTGTELLLGQTLNTHLQHIALRLADIGVCVQRQVTVPDGLAIREAMNESLARAELVLVTGGLGPTSDDVTRDMAANLLGRKKVFHGSVLEKIRERFLRRGLVMPEQVAVQAWAPEGAEILPNDCGTAPGLYLIGREGQHIFLLPGPPSELNPMFEQSVMPLLRSILPEPPPEPLFFRLVGVGESLLQEKIEPFIRSFSPDAEIGYCARPGEVDLRVPVCGDDARGQIQKKVESLFGDALYATGHESMEEVVVRLATKLGKTVAVAESCTGGLIANRITNVPGSSAVFLGGAVVYANSEKVRQLGVPIEMIEKHGAVSGEVAEAMAHGIAERTGADVAASSTGVAGPGSGTAEKPAGLCWLGFCSAIEKKSLRKHLATERESFKYMASQQVLDGLRRTLLMLGAAK